MRDDQKRRAIQLINAIKTRGSTVSLDAVAEMLNELLWEEAAPDGWKLVPVKPTPEMVAAWNDDDTDDFHHAYRAMLAAAPESPAVQEKRGLPNHAASHGFSRQEWHDKAWALYHSQTFDDTMLAKVNVHTIRKVFDATFDALNQQAPAVQETWSAEQCAQVLRALRYIQGIAERGEGRPMRDNESLEEFLLGYVQRLERKAPAAQADLRDAERYRWLKARAQKDTSYDRFGPDGCHWSIGFYGKSAQSLDAAIDAAIAAEKGGVS